MRWLRFFLAAFLLFTYAGVPAQHVVNGHRKQNFDRDWKFLLGDHQNASATGFNDGNWRTLDLPHDWSIEGKIDSTNPSGGDGGYFPTGIAWYRKTFRLGQLLQQKKVGIYFEGVYMNAEVYINGKSLGTRQGNEYCINDCVLACYYCNNDKSYTCSKEDYKKYFGPTRKQYFISLMKQL